ncbi:MAG: MarR family winged helix-turn-helix transcriptional regulator [Actinomycetota bacterium]|nr:MarR family winged helix-turn-helix transcriptional regulator [Actinomycetota bacterium]
MPTPLPLPTLLSQALVAFTIEFDNEFEHRMPHRTTRGSAGDAREGPWLVSLVMWSDLMRFVGAEGVPVREIADAGGNLKGMQRWGYVVLEPDSRGEHSPRSDEIARPTGSGRAAQEIWRPLFDVIEGRWQGRFGEQETGRLRESLPALVGRFDLPLPEYLPVLGPNLRARLPHVPVVPAPHLPALLSQVLLAFTLECEQESPLALTVGANLVRVLDERGVRVRDLPRLTGVSKEAISILAGALERGRYATVETDPTARSSGKILRLTRKGLLAHEAYGRIPAEVERRWEQRFGEENVREVRESLEKLVCAPESPSRLFEGIEPYADGWRASLPPPEVLPHHPMVLHRGGFPDGS